jgi:putative spermidine/putrescine transport system substrate-binding protein
MAAPFVLRSAHAQAKRIYIPSYGGSYQEMLTTAFAAPFTKETGVEVVFSGVPDLARLKAQVRSGRPEWDLFEAVSAWLPIAARENFLEPLDSSIVPKELMVTDYYGLFYRSIMAPSWNTAARDNGPRNFSQFWDLKSFPGPRTLRNRADLSLEIALVADGADPTKLYPLDVERAFASLGRLKPSVTKWSEATTQLTTLVATKEVEYSLNYTNRVKSAQASGMPIALSLDQTFITHEYIGVVKGTPRKELAMQFLAFALRPDRQAAFCELSSLFPGTPAALAMLSAEAKKWLPDLDKPGHIVQKEAWWLDNQEDIQKRFQSFMFS